MREKNYLFFPNPYELSKNTAYIIFILPVVLFLILAIFFYIPETRQATCRMLDENGPIEILTFIFFIIGGFYGFYLFSNIYSTTDKYVSFFYLIFSIFLILIAMEEIAWGQWFFNFDTPEEWAKINVQGETTLHNIEGMHGKSEILRLIFGVGGLIGLVFGNISLFKKIAVPKILILWFIIITIHATMDLYADFKYVYKPIYIVLNESDEFVEMLISIVSLLYIVLNTNLLKKLKLIE